MRKLSGVYLDLVDFKEVYDNLSTEPIFINDFNLSSEEDRKSLNKLIYTNYEGTTLSHMPSCICGHSTGSGKKGSNCPKCHTAVLLPNERKIESLLWIRAPEGVHSLFNPVAWTIIKESLTQSGCSLLDWFTNASYTVTNKLGNATPALVKIHNNVDKYLPDFKRSYNYFCENFDVIVQMLYELKLFKQKKNDLANLMSWFKFFRPVFFTDILPVPSKVAFITEQTSMSTFVDFEITNAVQAVRIFSEIEHSPKIPTLVVKQQKTVSAINLLMDFYTVFIKNSLAQKQGWFRKHVYGGRTAFNGRAVISSKTEPHHRQDLDIPWGLACKMLSTHITKKLIDMGYTPNEAKQHIDEHTLQHSPILEEIFNELIAEAKKRNGHGIPCLLLRNPSLTRGSIQFLYITTIINDPIVITIRLSALILSSFNADPALKVTNFNYLLKMEVLLQSNL